ncbi:14606_t:CDS:2, partial [Cetraspora pellucida]
MSTNILGNLYTNIEHERQEALKVMVTQLINDIKTLQSSYQKLKIKENDCKWWQNKVLPTVNSERSEANILSWKSSDDVHGCLENLDTMMEEEEKTYLQMVAKK